MAVHARFMAMLVAAAVGGAAEVPGRVQGDLLISANRVLADINELQVVLATQETREIERRIAAPGLKIRIEQKLREAGMRMVERDAETTPRLIVHMEGVEVPGANQYVYHVQTALGRLVTIPGWENRRLQAEVWQVRPVMAVAPGAAAGDAVSAAVMVQVEAFVAACKAARELRDLTGDLKEDVAGIVPAAHSSPSSLQAVATYPFVASKSSGVFHRPDCRWAQNISDDNRIGYKTREEAEQSGKRPCKSCRP